jgi:peptidoglycan/LPS O-acetylase OafA/YrhL
MAGKSGNIPSLDGIRAIAVCVVFFAHSGLEHLIPGGLGVTIFFVLSGYLISTLMRMEHAASGALDFRAFYLRRLLRLMPPRACSRCCCISVTTS